MRITSQSTSVAAWLLFMGALLLVMAVGPPYGASKDGPVPGTIWGFSAFLALLGLPLVYFGVKRVVHRLRFGGWELDCPDRGGQLGQPLTATIVPPQVVTPVGEVACNLSCFHTTPHQKGSGKVFDHSWSFRSGVVSPHAGLPITVELPEFGHPSKRARNGNTQWKLSVTIPAEGMKHEMEFEIPVKA